MTSNASERLSAALTGPYRIERELGEGGMAKVYLARDLRHNRNVALKVLKLYDSGEADGTFNEQMFAAEEQAESLLDLDDALARLASVAPRLVQVVECRFFGGMTDAEIAAVQGVTERTVRRDWDKARLLLRSALDA